MNSNEIINYTVHGFDNAKYYKLQRDAIRERVQRFSGGLVDNGGRLYLEVAGKFFYDPHAARVLPGFDPEIKQKILADFMDYAEIVFTVDRNAIVSDRQLKNVQESYKSVVWDKVKKIEENFKKRPIIAVNRITEKIHPIVQEFIEEFENKGYKIYKRYLIKGYPDSIDKILSEQGFGKDEYIDITKPLVIVVGPASSSGKLSTCLGQIYLDHEKGIGSGYAKYELFPIWNLPLEHPVNLAYEAATVDIGDFNTWDSYHLEAYDEEAVNYNRDEEAFELLRKLQEKVDPNNFIKEYKSPTDMGVSKAGFAITNDELVCRSALEEIKRRKVWYQDIVNRGDGKKIWVNRCKELESRAKKYIRDKYGK